MDATCSTIKIRNIPTPTARIKGGLKWSLLISERCLQKRVTPVNTELIKTRVQQDHVALWNITSLHQYRKPTYQHVSLCGLMSKSTN